MRDGAVFAASNAIFLEGDFVGNLVALKAKGYTQAEIQAELDHLLVREIGVHDDGRYLPAVPGMSWAAPEMSNI